MYTIDNNYTYELEIKKSRFIAVLIKVKDVKEIDNILENIKDKYKDATHYCYGYIVNDRKKSSDDNEPGGTAGLPILQALEKNNLNYVLCVVIRYFGGIKLGAGGLIRAYSKSTSEVIRNSNKIELIKGLKIRFITNYEDQKRIDYLLKDYQFTKEYGTNITYHALIPEDDIINLNIKDLEIIDKREIEKSVN